MSLAKQKNRVQNPGTNRSAKRRSVKYACAISQIAAVGQNYTHAAQNTNPGLYASIKQPLLRAEFSAIGNRASVKEWTQLNTEECSVIDSFAHFGVQQQITPSERCTPFSAIGGARMPAQPEIVIAFDRQLVKLIQRNRAGNFAAPQRRQEFVVVPARFRQPT